MSGNRSGSFSNLMGLECPVCLQIPKGEVYQCLNGHSVCSICSSKVQRCPSCRIFISGSSGPSVRNLYAETLLDGMKFGCAWRELGCTALTRRSLLSDHENMCKFGAINLCNGYTSCSFQFHPTALKNTEEVTKILDHMKSVHNFNVIKNVKLGSLWNFNMGYLQLESMHQNQMVNFEPTFVEVVNPDFSCNQLFVILCQSQIGTEGQKNVSWGFVRLTSNCINAELLVKLSMNMGGEPMEIAADWGKELLTEPSLSWTLKPLDGQHIMDLFKMPILNRQSLFFGLPLLQIENLFLTNGLFNLTYSIYKS